MNRIIEAIKNIKSAIYHALAGLFFLVFIMIILQACGNRGSESAHPERPNILFIITDQQHAGMMSCTAGLVVENNGARMLLFDRHWKYMVDEYTIPSDSMQPAEMLFDLHLRPQESKNLAGYKEYGSKRELAVGLMKKWYEDQELSPGGEYPLI